MMDELAAIARESVKSDEGRYFGVWTKDELIDTLIFALVAAFVTAIVTIIYRYISKWLELKKWG